MPRRNRVDPFGAIRASPERGVLMGNRGILHDDGGEVVRSHVGKAWISCDLSVPGPKRPLASPGSYTVLFFLDEATALAAGHRPCFSCRRAAAQAFRNLVAPGATAAALDALLHAERRGSSAPEMSADLPTGTMVGHEGEAWLRVIDGWRRWTIAGYVAGEPPAAAVVLTPPSIVAALRAGYQPLLHPSAA